ncbi:MAG: hypothetical protein AAGB11_03935 [Pseudomonadota bacterium]
MTPNVRMFASEDGAMAAEAALAENGFKDRTLLLPSLTSGKEEQAVVDAIAAGTIPPQTKLACVRSLRAGSSVVGVRAPFGTSATAMQLIGGIEGIQPTDALDRYKPSDPTPFSDWLRIPVLVPFRASATLVSHDWALFSFFKPLIKSPAPLSKLIGWKPLSKSDTGRTSSFGMPLLSKGAAPLSSMTLLPVLSRSQSGWRSSFGLPLLSKGPSPFSNLFGIKVLSNERGQGKRP